VGTCLRVWFRGYSGWDFYREDYTFTLKRPSRLPIGGIADRQSSLQALRSRANVRRHHLFRPMVSETHRRDAPEGRKTAQSVVKTF
jgi:hypothetical protein